MTIQSANASNTFGSPVPSSARRVVAESPRPPQIETFTTSIGGVEISLRGFLKGGEPWFIAKDVTSALGYASGPNAVAKHVDDDQRGVTKSMTPGGQQQLTIISEGGFYSLVMASKLPTAKAFKRWVVDVVLSSLRKHGGYVMGQEKLATGEMGPKEFMARALVMAQSVIADAERTIAAQRAEISGLTAEINGLAIENEDMKAELNLLSVDEWRALNHLYMDHSTKTKLGQRAALLCAADGILVQKQPRQLTCGRMTTVGVYPRDILDRVAEGLCF